MEHYPINQLPNIISRTNPSKNQFQKRFLLFERKPRLKKKFQILKSEVRIRSRSDYVIFKDEMIRKVKLMRIVE